MSHADPEAGYVALINTFTVEPDRAEELLDSLRHSISHTIRYLDGFMSARLHVSEDRRHVANCARWRRRVDFDAMLADPETTLLREATRALATHNDAVLYDVRDVIKYAARDAMGGTGTSSLPAPTQGDPFNRALADYFASRRGAGTT